MNLSKQNIDFSDPDKIDKYYDGPFVICDNFTCLMKLVSYSSKYNVNMVIKNILLEKKHEINDRNQYGYTALMLAVSGLACHKKYSNLEIIQMLVDAGADIDLVDRHGSSALLYAVRFGNAEILQIFLNAKHNINSRDQYGRTALMIACCFCDASAAQILTLLMESNPDYCLCDEHDKTALMHYINNMIYCINNNTDTPIKKILEILIVKSKLCIKNIDNNNHTAYDYYIARKYDILDEYFLELLQGKFILSNIKSAK